MVGIWNPDASSLGCVSECKRPYKENVPWTVLCCVFVLSLAPNQILILHVVLTQCRKRIRGAPHVHIYIMHQAHVFTPALGLFQEQKLVIGVPCLAAAPAPHPTKTDMDTGLTERQNALYNRLWRHLKCARKFQLTHESHDTPGRVARRERTEAQHARSLNLAGAQLLCSERRQDPSEGEIPARVLDSRLEKGGMRFPPTGSADSPSHYATTLWYCRLGC